MMQITEISSIPAGEKKLMSDGVQDGLILLTAATVLSLIVWIFKLISDLRDQVNTNKRNIEGGAKAITDAQALLKDEISDVREDQTKTDAKVAELSKMSERVASLETQVKLGFENLDKGQGRIENAVAGLQTGALGAVLLHLQGAQVGGKK